MAFTGELATAYRACLWSRLASRVLLPLATFAVVDDADLYAGVQTVDWLAHLDERRTLAVSFTVRTRSASWPASRRARTVLRAKTRWPPSTKGTSEVTTAILFMVLTRAARTSGPAYFSVSIALRLLLVWKMRSDRLSEAALP